MRGDADAAYLPPRVAVPQMQGEVARQGGAQREEGGAMGRGLESIIALQDH